MTKMQAYRICQEQGMGFIANVVLCHHSDPARKLKALAKLALAGRTVSFLSFSTDVVMLDGYQVTWPVIEATAKHCGTTY
jgi:hypothetical protein